MKRLANVFACLVHEQRACVVDLVRNLRYLDPASTVLLYNGGEEAGLLDELPFAAPEVLVHPRPRRLEWGRLHAFALDSMRWLAGERIPFDTLTIVDSDQLGCRADYSVFLARWLAGRRKVGLLGSTDLRQVPGAAEPPAAAALEEIELWQPLLELFPGGEEKFVHWSFWPATVFTAPAAGALVDLFERQPLVEEILARSGIWATEEVVLPTLVALLGFGIERNPCSLEYVRYNERYRPEDVGRALDSPRTFWLHPIPRSYGDPLRDRVRDTFDHYLRVAPRSRPADGPEPKLRQTAPILERMRSIPGWLSDEEADLLVAATFEACERLEEPGVVLEIGSFCGRATVVLASALELLGADATVVANGPHDGRVGALDKGVEDFGPTCERLREAVTGAGLESFVEIVEGGSAHPGWSRPIALLVVDGLHDYPSVARDFHRFESWVAAGGLVAFHDYGDYYPGVRVFVDELLLAGRYRKVASAGSLIVVQKEAAPARRGRRPGRGRSAGGKRRTRPTARRRVDRRPLVSCVMPTRDRHDLARRAIDCYLAQNYPHRELIVLDNGADPVAGLVPNTGRTRYVRDRGLTSLGAIRNAACELARGELIAHWDDDDWSAPWRLSYQVEALLHRPEAELCGLSRVFFYDDESDRAWIYDYPAESKAWVCGATFLFRKSLWRRHRFPELDEGEDTEFVWSLDDRLVLALPDNGFFVGAVHAGNSSPKETDGPHWKAHSAPSVRRLMEDRGRARPRRA